MKIAQLTEEETYFEDRRDISLTNIKKTVKGLQKVVNIRRKFVNNSKFL